MYSIKRWIFVYIILFLFACEQADKRAKFVEINKINKNIVLDIRYATPNNFLKRSVYPSERCFVVYEAAVKLDSIQKDLENQGLGLKIFDGYRPLSVQKMMWEILPDDRYVANPKYGSRHNRGAAVDVSLVDSTGVELNMPTDFDDFSEKAAHSYQDMPEEVIKNRGLLKQTMEKYGFVSLDSEWWHYDLKNYTEYPVMDLTFDEIDQQPN